MRTTHPPIVKQSQWVSGHLRGQPIAQPKVTVWRGDYVAVNREAREAALREGYFAEWQRRLKARDWV
jgi:hypothetical protein